jgi:hypothetical protein
MDTDGGGYTSFAVTGGAVTRRRSDYDTCQHYGLQMLVPRTQVGEWRAASGERRAASG